MKKIILFLFRAIFFPFKQKIKTKYIISVSLTIILCSLGIGILESTQLTLTRSVHYIEDVFVYQDRCLSIMKEDILNIYLFILYPIGTWLPMLLVIMVHVSMYLKLKKLALVRAESTRSDTQGQLRRISRVFLVTVIGFYICTLPISVLNFTLHIAKIPSNIYIDTVFNLLLPLKNFNSCINPLIYSKIHQKIYSGMMLIKRRVISMVSEPRNQLDNHITVSVIASRNNENEKFETKDDEVSATDNKSNDIQNPVYEIESNEINHIEENADEIVGTKWAKYNIFGDQRDTDKMSNSICNNNYTEGIEMNFMAAENNNENHAPKSHEEKVYLSDSMIDCHRDSIGKHNDAFSKTCDVH